MTKNKKSADKNMFSYTRQNYYTFVPNFFFFFGGGGRGQIAYFWEKTPQVYLIITRE